MTESTEIPTPPEIREELLDLVQADQMALDSNGLGGALIVAVFVHALATSGEAEVAVDMQADRLACLGFQGLVKLHRILMQLTDGIAHVEEGQ